MMTACTKAPSSTPTADPAPPPPPSASAPGPAPAQRPIDKQNDLALTLIREKRWTEAVDAARAATQLDEKSAAAWFNLGRALLGAGQPWDASSAFGRARAIQDSADAAYFAGQAHEAAGSVAVAAQTYEFALKRWPGDKEIAAALEALKAKYARYPYLPSAAGDMDGDGKSELVYVTEERVQLIGGTGAVLFEHALPKTPGIRGASIFPQEGALPLVAVYYGSCPSAPENVLLWFKDGKLNQDRTSCGSVGYAGGKISLTISNRMAPFAGISTSRWNEDKWVSESVRMVAAFDRINPDQLAWIFTELANSPVEGAETWFTPPDLYQTFKSRVGTGRWEFVVTAGKGTSEMTFEARRDQKVQGQLTTTVKDGKITALKWLD